jgi:hypothetical protein
VENQCQHIEKARPILVSKGFPYDTIIKSEDIHRQEVPHLKELLKEKLFSCMLLVGI